MPYDFSVSLAMIPFDLVILMNLILNYGSLDSYRKNMRRAFAVLLLCAVLDVVAGVYTNNAYAADATFELRVTLYAAYAVATFFVAWYIFVYHRALVKARRGEGDKLFYAMPLWMLLAFLVPVFLLLFFFSRIRPQLMVYTAFLSVLSYAFYFMTELPLIARLQAGLKDLSGMLEEAEKATERARAQDLAKNDFLANMSHEIRTPLNAILGMNEMVLRESKEKQVTGYARVIEGAGDNLLAIINDIIDFSRIEAGDMQLLNETYHLGYVLNTVKNMIALRASDKGLTLVTRIDETLPDLLSGDELRLSQVLINLLTNAVKYTNHGTVTLSVSAAKRSKEEVTLVFDVIDTGIGIREENLPHLFDSFTRFDAEENRNIEGTGLGLTITRNLVRLMGGEIYVASVYQEGSTFSVRLTQKVVGEATLAEYAIGEAEDRSGETRRFFAPEANVLVVDDTKSNITVVEMLLKQTRINVDSCMSGEECLTLAQNMVYDVILLDHMMPGMDGIETLHRLRDTKGFDRNKTHVIVLTANAIAGAREQYLEEGFDDYLSKPVDSLRLEEMLMKHLPERLVITAKDPEYTDLLAQLQEESAQAQLLAQKNEEASLQLRTLQGVDYDAAIAVCASDEILRTTICDFYDAISEQADLIEQYARKKDWNNYTIKVHALKSSARLIGATALSADAAFLEQKGNEQEEAEIERLTPKLLADYRAYLEHLASVAAGEDDAEEDKALVDLDELNEAYEAIKEFAEANDFDSVDAIINQLNGYRIPDEEKEKFELVRKLCRQLDKEALLQTL